MSTNVIGIAAFFHDSACCLLQDGKITAAAEEERFSRIKADPTLPKEAFKYCLEQGDITIADIDCIAYYEDPEKKLARQFWSGVLGNHPDLLHQINPSMVEDQIREVLGYEGPIKYYDHHSSHAASSFFFSGFKESAILTVDGVGEWATTTYGMGKGNTIDLFEEVHFPDSLGLLYSTITSYLGFGVNDGEYKVMGLAPYGKPLYVDKIYELVQQGADGQYTLDMKYFNFIRGKTMYSELLPALFGQPVRREDSSMDQFHKDVAKSIQVALEEILLQKVNYLHKKTNTNNLCMAGGVALNCVANGQILRKGPFENLFVQPAANDAGGAIGAAALAHIEITGERPAEKKLQHVYLGPAYSSKSVDRLLRSTSIQYKDCRDDYDTLLALTAERLAQGKVIGWFQGRMEFGPRSLGARSILADPRNVTMRDRINAMVKKREGFRPFAPAVLDAKAAEHFDLDHPSPFMLETCQVVSGFDLPAITHVDGSARVQTVHRETNPRFYDLIKAFYELTGCPILLNTSFNIKGEPIVCTPEDATRCFITTDIDSLVMEDFIIDRDGNNLEILKLLLTSQSARPGGITHDVYTFV
ncbi:carbamoyltransferase [Paraflavitalea soli]|uniref:Carbamoyltransferase n=1 Tax=Paraflavitalea soli TaxID=2315862 RepID=A0A3B7MMJ6_9BACT|nr:carbamoyltransferase [Paraflavitalea soli]AXY74559.1 carbamoyltransferase [Paraflavitalea soli]